MSFDPRRPGAGGWLAGTGGAALVVALFLPWYSAGSASTTGWEALREIDALLAVTGAGALALLACGLLARTAPVPITLASLLALVTPVAAAFACYRLAVVPNLDRFAAGQWSREAGPYLAVGGALGCFAGTVLSLRDQGPALRTPEAEARAREIALERAELVSPNGGGRTQADRTGPPK